MSIAVKTVLVASVFVLTFLLGRTVGELLGERRLGTAQSAPTAAASPGGALRANRNVAGREVPSTVPSVRIPPPATFMPTPQPTATALAPTAQPNASAIQQRIVDAEAALRTGELVATIDYGDQNTTAVELRFDFGMAQESPRLQITSIYTSGTQIQITERITIGNRSWQRQDQGKWLASDEQTSIVEQVLPFLPSAASLSDPEVKYEQDLATLSGFDASRDADITLLVDPASGVPRQMEQMTRQTRRVLSVTYRGWNTPIEIVPPES